MTIKTNVKAGALTSNHNETLTVRSGVKAGALPSTTTSRSAARAVARRGRARTPDTLEP